MPANLVPTETAVPRAVPATTRRLGSYGGQAPGPTLVAVGGMHGNEPSGVRAIARVLERLNAQHPAMRGRFVALAGNLPALARGVRFIDEDFNRIFGAERVGRAAADLGPPGSCEAEQQRELLGVLHEELAGAGEFAYFLDLHTSSAPGEPFVCIGDTLRNRRFALQFPVPVLLGLEEQVDGALLEYVNNRGHVTVGVEAGQHDLDASVDHHEAVLLLALIAAGCLEEEAVPDAAALRSRLRTAVGELPPVMEVRYRHPVRPGDGFVMRPGYENFQRVEAGEIVAADAVGEIAVPETGRILLPLYQGLGSDGFFVVREVRPFWLRVSELLRRLRLDRVVHWLPGVRRGPASDSLTADPRVARWYTVEIFHLLGFRKERSAGDRLMFTRRVE